MKIISNTNRHFFLLLLLLLQGKAMQAQKGECIFRDTLFRIDFGSMQKPQLYNLRSLKNYQLAFNDCPDDGFYSYSSRTSGCFNDDWITLTEDHTAGDSGGKMFFVNSAPRASRFFIVTLDGFKPNTRYEFGVWMLNLCKLNRPCPPLPPSIVISLQTAKGVRLASFNTGKVVSTERPYWKKYFAYFTTPADGTALTLTMDNNSDGGCGNDFAMDDITFRECYTEQVVKVPAEKKSVPQPAPIEQKPVPVKKVNEQLKSDTIVAARIPVESRETEWKISSKQKPVLAELPLEIKTRENPVIRTIKTAAADILIQLYDNGQVDGDTVTIYHNNELLVSHAGLSEKPVSFRVQVNKDNPHHEITMVADNLGSIPPNTSLMVITANKKRYEVFISSSEVKNARLVIDLE